MSHAARYNKRAGRYECACGETFVDINAHQRHMEAQSPTTPVKHQITYHPARATFRCSCGVFESESSFAADHHLAAFQIDPQSAAAIAKAFDVTPTIATAVPKETAAFFTRVYQPTPRHGGADFVRRSWINRGPELDAFMSGFEAGRTSPAGRSADAWNTYITQRITRHGSANPGEIPPSPRASQLDHNKLADGINEYADRLDKAADRTRNAGDSGATLDTLSDFARHLSQLLRDSGGS